jgi:hypothetical protein
MFSGTQGSETQVAGWPSPAVGSLFQVTLKTLSHEIYLILSHVKLSLSLALGSTVASKCSVPDQIRKSRYFWASRIQIRIGSWILLIFFSPNSSEHIQRRLYEEKREIFALFFKNLLGGIWGP